MKKLIGLYLAILLTVCSLTTKAQTEDTIQIPEWVATLVIDELIVKDGLVYELSKKDSILIVYERQIADQNKAIAYYQLNAQEYEAIMENKDLIISSKNKENKQLRRQVLGLKVVAVFEAITIAVIILASLFVV